MTARLLVGLVRLLFGAYPRWLGSAPSPRQRIYLANHTSHLDTRPVAARDYWGGGGVKGWIARRVLNVVLIERRPEMRQGDPLQPLHEALAAGASLVLFPKGTRNDDAVPGGFKAGLYHLAQRHPQVELVPVYLDNARRCLPRGSWWPVPLVCTARFGAPLALQAGEEKTAFLARTRAAVMELGG